MKSKAAMERAPSGVQQRRRPTTSAGSVATLATVRSAYASSLYSLQMGGEQGENDALNDQQWVLQVSFVPLQGGPSGCTLSFVYAKMAVLSHHKD